MTPLSQRPWFLPSLAPLLVGALLLLGWQGFCRGQDIPPYVFPAPTDIARALAANLPVLLHALVQTLRVTFTSLGLAVLIGTLVAAAFVQSRAIEMSLFPYVVLLQVTPIVAVAPLIIILVKNTQTALVVCATVITLFPVISNTTIGLRSVDPGLLNYFRMNGAGRLPMLFRLRVPSALPFFLAGLRIASGLSLIGAVVAEFVAGTGGRSAGLAYEILQAGYALDIPLMFAALLLIAVTGILMYLAVLALSAVLLRGWQGA